MEEKRKPRSVELAYIDGVNTSIVVNLKILTLYDSMMILFTYNTDIGDVNDLKVGNSEMQWSDMFWGFPLYIV